jgi:hypothetical protein
VISGWDEAETARGDLGHLGAAWTYLSHAIGSKRIGVNRISPRKNGLWFKGAGGLIAADHIPFLDE